MERLHIVTYRHNFETRDFKIQRRDGNENVKKTIGLNKQNNNLERTSHVFCTIRYRFCENTP